MKNNTEPIILGNTQREIADHEAGHVVVAHNRGCVPLSTQIFESKPGFFEGFTHHRNPGNSEASEDEILISFAGYLAQAKGWAERNTDLPVTFSPNQDWGLIAMCFYPGEEAPLSDCFVFSQVPNVVNILWNVRPSQWSKDATAAMEHLTKMRQIPSKGSVAPYLKRCGEILDNPKNWERVKKVSSHLQSTTPVNLYRVDEPDLRELMH